MKNIIVVMLVLMGGGVFAQQGKLTDEKRKEFDAQKVAFFTQEMDLSPAEAAVFWPLYNEMQKKNREIEAQMRQEYRAVREAKGVKEANYAESINKMLAAEQKMQDIKKEYYNKMVKALPASKIWKLGDAERKFHRQLFDKLKREACQKK